MKNKKANLLCLILFSALSLPSAFAQQKAAAGNDAVLDFDADVIEGQKKAPEMFLQLDTDRPNLRAVLLERKDFNEFHAIDSLRRPRISDTVGGK